MLVFFFGGGGKEMLVHTSGFHEKFPDLGLSEEIFCSLGEEELKEILLNAQRRWGKVLSVCFFWGGDGRKSYTLVI